MVANIFVVIVHWGQETHAKYNRDTATGMGGLYCDLIRWNDAKRRPTIAYQNICRQNTFDVVQEATPGRGILQSLVDQGLQTPRLARISVALHVLVESFDFTLPARIIASQNGVQRGDLLPIPVRQRLTAMRRRYPRYRPEELFYRVSATVALLTITCRWHCEEDQRTEQSATKPVNRGAIASSIHLGSIRAVRARA